MKNHLHNDVWIYRLVLALSEQFTTEGVVALGSAAIGGSAGLLAPSPFNR
jgi:hypothetical protein